MSGSVLSVKSNQNVESKTENVVSKIAFLLQEIRTVIKLLPPDVRFKAEMHQNPISAGAPPQTRWWGAYSVPPDLLAGFQGVYILLREVEGGERCGVQKKSLK